MYVWYRYIQMSRLPQGHTNAVAEPGGPRGHGPPGPVTISHKKDGHQRCPHRFHVSHPPLPDCWMRYCNAMIKVVPN